MPIKTVQDLIDQLSLLPSGSHVGVGTSQVCAAIKQIHSVEMFGEADSPAGARTSTIHHCIILEPFQKPDLPSEDEIKAKMASHRS